ncbi:MAG: DUF389 domain-containing protein [Anaerolineaceae bacterium]
MTDLPEGFSPLPPTPEPVVERRRRRRRPLIPAGKGDRALYVGQIASRLVPSFDFFLFSLLSGLVLALGVLLNSPAIYVLSALLSPFMAPLIGLGFSAAIGSLSFFLQSLAGLLLGAGLVFGSGALGGWISKLLPGLSFDQALLHTQFTLPDFVLLTIGAVLAIYLTVRNPKQRSLVASVALAYEVYLPIGIAGFGLTSGMAGSFPEALKVAAVHVGWVLLVGTVVLIFMRLRPFTFFGVFLSIIVIAAAVYGLVVTSAFGVALEKQILPQFTLPVGQTQDQSPIKSATLTPSPRPATQTAAAEIFTPTNTLRPTNTATVTITPKPTPVWAMVNSPSATGIVVRENPTFTAKYLASLLNGALVQVLPETVFADNNYWVHVITEDGTEGWVVRSLIATATPAPGW